MREDNGRGRVMVMVLMRMRDEVQGDVSSVTRGGATERGSGLIIYVTSNIAALADRLFCIMSGGSCCGCRV